MLSESGPAKNSGKIVTIEMRSIAALVEEPGRNDDDHPLRLDVDLLHDVVAEREADHRAPIAHDVEDEPLGKLVDLADGAQRTAGVARRAVPLRRLDHL